MGDIKIYILKKKKIIGLLLLLAVVLFGFKYVVSIVYILKGSSTEFSLKMGEHARVLASSNLRNIDLYLDKIWDRPELKPHKLPPQFFGLNVAAPEEARFDDFIINDLKFIGVQTIRVDYGFGYDINLVRIDQFLKKAVKNFPVILHIVQHPDKAKRMTEDSIQIEWREFLRKVFDELKGSSIEIEIGSLPNRKKWSGYTIPDYLKAIEIASEVSKEYNLPILGPNIQDFEPFWQVAFLDLFKTRGIKLSGSTDNLFVDRAVQPELYDTHVLGERFADNIAMDLLNKSRFLDLISERFGVDRFISSFTQWNLSVPAPYYFASQERLATVDKYADYMVRYFLLSAAGGYLDSIYWGEYASYKEGILDDSYNPTEAEVPFPDAHHKFFNIGDVSSYKKRAAWFAYKKMTSIISESTFTGRLNSEKDSYILRFSKKDEEIIVLWALNGSKISYSNSKLNNCSLIDAGGDEKRMPESVIITGTPQYIMCKKNG